MASTNEAKIKFNADCKEFNAQIKAANASLKEMRAELNLNNEQMKNGGDALDLLWSSYNHLASGVDAAAEKVEAMRGKVQSAIDNYGEGSVQVDNWRAELAKAELEQEKLTQALEDCRNSISQYTVEQKQSETETAKLNTQIESQETVLEKLKAQYVEARLKFGENSKEAKTLASQIQSVSKELQENKDKMKQAEEAADSYDKTLQDAEEANKRYKESLEILKGVFNDIDGAIDNLIKRGLKEVINFAKEAATDVVESGMEYESAFMGIRKTVDMTGYTVEEADAKFALLDTGLRQMATTMPQTQEELAGIGEMAGQMGIKLGENGEVMLGFIKTMGDLGVATDIVGQEGVENFSKFVSITGLADDQYSNFGSTLVACGNNFAATEKEILNMSMNLASAGTTAGMTQSEIVGLATGLVALGLKAQAGGSSFSKVINWMELATGRTDELDKVLKKSGISLREIDMLSQNDSKSFKELAQSLGYGSTELKQLIKEGTNLEDFATVAGMTSKQFVKAWKEDATSALTAFIYGLGQTNELGDNVTATLSEMGITELRVSDALRRTANSATLFEDAISTATTAWEENTALTEEAEKYYSTLESKVQMLKNSIHNVSLELYDYFNPYMKEAVDAFNSWIQTDEAQGIIEEVGETLAEMAKGVLADLPNTISTISGLLQGVPAVISGVSNAIQFVSGHIQEIINAIKAVIAIHAVVKLGETIASIKQVGGAIATVITHIVMMATGLEKAAAAQAILNAAQLAAPYVAAATAIIGVVAGLAALISHIVKAKDNTEACKSELLAMAESMGSFDKAVSACSPHLADLSNVTGQYGHTVTQVDNLITEGEKRATDILRQAATENRALRDDEIAQIQDYNNKIAQLEAEKAGIYKTNLEVTASVIAAQEIITREQLAQYVTDVNASYEQASTAIDANLTAQQQRIYKYYQERGELNSAAMQQELRDAQAAADAEKEVLRQRDAEILSMALDGYEKSISLNAEMWQQEYANNNRGRDAFMETMRQMDLDNTQAWLSMVSTIKTNGGQVTAETEQTAKTILLAFKDMPDSLEEAGREILLGLIDGMDSKIPALSNAADMTCDEIVDTVLDGLEIHSPSRVMISAGQNVVQGLADGMKNKSSAVNSAATDIAKSIIDGLTPDQGSAKAIGQNTAAAVESGLNGKQGAITGAAQGIAKGVISSLTPDAGAVKNVGGNIVTGIDSGMQNKSSWLGSRIANFASGIVDRFRNAFKIGSPSRIMAEDIGEWLPAGIGKGIEDNAGAAIQPLKALVNSMTGAKLGFGNALGGFSLDISSRIEDHMMDAFNNNSQFSMMERMADAMERLANIEFIVNMDISGQRVAQATASASDSVSGTRINLRERGLALE